MESNLNKLLQGSQLKTQVAIESSLAGVAGDLLERIGFSKLRIALVCDAGTHAALGARLMEELAYLKPQLILLKGKVHADEAAHAIIAAAHADAFVAVGSGTINDLCKYASFLNGAPYAVFPTAPSMNGYLSANASITLNRVKESRHAHLPSGVFCDLGIIAAAPPRLIKSGLGDSLCRPTAQADWLLSHLVLGTTYDAKIFEMLEPYEAELFSHADKLIAGDVAVVELLLKTLLVSGLGMTLAGGSYPASEAEHMIAHTMEMKHGDNLPETFHGEQIGVTTLTMAEIQEAVLSKPLRLPACPGWEGALAAYFGRTRAQYIAQSAQKKYMLYERYEAIASNLSRHEAEIRDAIRKVTLPEAQLREVLQKAGAPITASELGWSQSDYDNAISHARFTRDRFTFLDLLD